MDIIILIILAQTKNLLKEITVAIAEELAFVKNYAQ
jgi:hypothetical protein